MRITPAPLCLAAALASPALAGDDAALQARVFGKPLGEAAAYACFTRAYSKDHLASHPRQNVISIMLLVKGTAEGGPHYNAGVDFRFRKSGKHFQATGECPSLADASSGQELHCGIDCDGGTINVSLGDANTVLVKLPAGIAVSEAGKDEAVPSEARFGNDDKVFKLARTAGSACLPLALDEADKAALQVPK